MRALWLWARPATTEPARLAKQVVKGLTVCSALALPLACDALAQETAEEETSAAVPAIPDAPPQIVDAFDALAGDNREPLSEEAQQFLVDANRFAEGSVESSGEQRDLRDPEAAKFDAWRPLAEEELSFQWEWDGPAWRPSTWFHRLGFRHSSTHGRNVGRGIPLKNASWRNRPYHVDWFVGQLLSDNLINNRVAQQNAFFSGLRLGWDFDHYWGMEWRFGWADPDVQYATPLTESNTGSYFVSDVDLIYYPWGDSKIRPYALLGMGMTRVKFLDENSINQDSTMLTVPYGAGIQFPQWPWLIWRLEILNQVSFGSDNISAMGNVSFTVGMEWRLGAQPSSYWPWRSSRSIW